MKYVREVELILKPKGAKSQPIQDKIILRTDRPVSDKEMNDVLTETMTICAAQYDLNDITFERFVQELDHHVSKHNKSIWHVEILQPRTAFRVTHESPLFPVKTTTSEKSCGLPIEDPTYK